MLQSRFYTDINSSTIGHIILGYSEHRRSITFFPQGGDLVSVQPGSIPPVAGGITLSAGQLPVTLDVEHHGELVKQEWYAIYQSGGVPFCWIEVLDCPCEYPKSDQGPNNVAYQSPAELGRLKR